jgi:type IV pilus assembly protein PilE
MPTPQVTPFIASLLPSPVRSAGTPMAFRRQESPSETIVARACHRGFTAVELLITVAVIGILAAVAFPSYQEYLKRSHRSSAQSLMLDLANREQQYLLDNRAFLGGGASAVTTLLPSGVPTEVSNFYTLTITATAGPPPTFEVKATPNTGTVMAGETPFTLDQDGTKLPAGKWQGR